MKENEFEQRKTEASKEIMSVVAAIWNCQQDHPAGRLMAAPASLFTPDWKTYIVRFASMMVSKRRCQVSETRSREKANER